MDFGTAKEALNREIAQRSHAVVLLDSVAGLADDLRGTGFGVGVEVGPIEDGRVVVSLSVTCPNAFSPDDGAPELVEHDEPVVPEFLRRVPDAPVEVPPLDVKESAPARTGQPWTQEEDAELVRLRAACVSFEAISEKLGRPVPGLQYRCSKVLHREIAKASAAKSKSVAKPAPVKAAPVKAVPAHVEPKPDAPKPAPRVVETADPRPVIKPAVQPSPAQNCSPIAPDTCGDEISRGLMDAHLRWLYGATPDRDAVACDLDLVEMLARGDGAQAVAEEFDWPKAQVLSRWHDLRGGASVTLNLQRVLLDALRALASGAAA